MTYADLIVDVYGEYKGKAQGKVPAANSDKWIDLLSLANRRIQRWAKDPNQKWSSLFEVRSQGTLSTALSYELDEDVWDLSDYVYALSSGLEVAKIPVVKPHQRKDYATSVYLAGDPKTLYFTDTTMNPARVGNTLSVPLYFLPEDLTGANSEVPNQPYEWLVLELAASLARNDPAKDDQYANLKGEANDAYRLMVENNQNSPSGQLNAIPYDNVSIGMD